MGRPAGSRNTLVRLDYDSIGELVGIRGNTARRYASRGQYNPRDLDSLLRWVNSRRHRHGEPLIGLPTDVGEDHSDDTAVNDAPVETDSREDIGRPCQVEGHGGLVYDPMTGGFRGFDDDENR